MELVLTTNYASLPTPVCGKAQKMKLWKLREIKTKEIIIALVFVGLTIVCPVSRASGQTTNTQMPTTPLSFGDLLPKFAGDGTFTVDWSGKPALNGTWKVAGDEIELMKIGRAHV